MKNETTVETTIDGFCDICGNQETDNAATLQSAGWFLGIREEFCPSCND